MNSVCFILWIFFAYKKIAPNSYLHTKELFHWNTQRCKKQPRFFDTGMEASASAQKGAFLHHPGWNWQPQGWQKCPCWFFGALCCWTRPCLGRGQQCLCTEWLCGFLVQEKLASKIPCPQRWGFSLSARCPGIMDSTWQQFSWKTTGAYACDYTYVCAHMHACTDIFTVLCLHIQRYLFIWKSKPTSVF